MTSKLSALLKLLDDDSAVVRDAVGKELAALGPELDTELGGLPEPPAPGVRERIDRLLAGHRRAVLREAWGGWMGIPGKEGLEQALTLLSDCLAERPSRERLPALLSELAAECSAAVVEVDPFQLARFLFGAKQFRGAAADYYHPANSSLVQVIHSRRGIPISLACVYILVGHRLGLPIEGCNYPGHFLARCVVHGQIFFIDCYDRGRFLTEEDLLGSGTTHHAAAARALRGIAGNAAIVERVLRNVAGAYARRDDRESADFFQELIDLTRAAGGEGA